MGRNMYYRYFKKLNFDTPETRSSRDLSFTAFKPVRTQWPNCLSLINHYSNTLSLLSSKESSLFKNLLSALSFSLISSLWFLNWFKNPSKSHFDSSPPLIVIDFISVLSSEPSMRSVNAFSLSDSSASFFLRICF